jgi:hypothetical protein
MSDLNVTSMMFQPPASQGPLAGRQQKQLREAVDEVVGITFYGQMFKMARNDPLKGQYGHGGRGEEVFGAQLDMELARLASRRTASGLNEAIFRHLSGNSRTAGDVKELVSGE